MAIEDSIVGVESGGNPNARNPNSSASGPGQFIDSTWLNVLRQHRPDLANGKSDADLLALKNDPQLSRDMTAAYAADNQQYLTKNGVPVTPGNTYLAHFAGPQGAVSVLKAAPNTPIEQILTPGAIAANPFLKGMTAQNLQAWAAKKMGSQSPTAPTPGAPMTLPSAPPIFAQQPQSQPQQPQQTAAAAPGYSYVPFKDPTPPPMQAPIFAPRPVDLSGLRAQLAQQAQSPIFVNRG